MTHVNGFPTHSHHSNQLLDALPADERNLLEADLEWVLLPRDLMLYEGGATLRHVYFPANAIVSLVSSLADGAATEVAVVGNEGVVGVCAFLGGGLALSSAVVERPGYGWRMRADTIARHTQRSGEVMRPMLRYAQTLFTHLVQTACCNQHHTLEQQVCRWILLHSDRQEGNALAVTQERIAIKLGVRREGVTGAAVNLQQAGLIRYSRGQIHIADRKGLEARCCECYSAIRQADVRLTAAPERRTLRTAAA